jgi:hypothetical protein
MRVQAAEWPSKRRFTCRVRRQTSSRNHLDSMASLHQCHRPAFDNSAASTSKNLRKQVRAVRRFFLFVQIMAWRRDRAQPGCVARIPH